MQSPMAYDSPLVWMDKPGSLEGLVSMAQMEWVEENRCMERLETVAVSEDDPGCAADTDCGFGTSLAVPDGKRNQPRCLSLILCIFLCAGDVDCADHKIGSMDEKEGGNRFGIPKAEGLRRKS